MNVPSAAKTKASSGDMLNFSKPAKIEYLASKVGIIAKRKTSNWLLIFVIRFVILVS